MNHDGMNTSEGGTPYGTPFDPPVNVETLALEGQRSPDLRVWQACCLGPVGTSPSCSRIDPIREHAHHGSRCGRCAVLSGCRGRSPAPHRSC